MVYTFDAKVTVDKYTKQYDKLSTIEKTEGIEMRPGGPKFKPASPLEYKKRLEDTIKDNTENTACKSCDKNGKCNRLKWNKDHSLLKVTGCSLHPDQKKYPGKSTTVVFTDNVYAGYNGAWDGDWNTLRNYTDGQYYFFAFAQGLCALGGGLYYMYRGSSFFDTSVIPDGDIINYATLKLYCAAQWLNYSTRNATCIVPTTGVIPPDVSNYNRASDSAEVASLSNLLAVVSSYNDFSISNLTCISKTGYTKFKHRHSGDMDNEAPPSDGNWGVDYTGSTDLNPPKLEVTWSSPRNTWPSPRKSLIKKVA